MENDWYIIGSVSVLICAGLLVLISFETGNWFSHNMNFLRQLTYVLIGYLVVDIFRTKDPKYLTHSGLLVILYIISIIVLVAVLVVGKEVNGAKSWFDLGIVSLQPADFVKVVFIAVLAKYLSKRHVAIGQIKHFFISILYCGIIVGLLLLQPDLGTVIVFCVTWFVMVLVSGVSRAMLLATVAGFIIISLVSWFFVFESYQKDRILTFLAPMSDISGSGYNAYQSVVAVGSGGLLGKGFGFGTQSRLEYLPEHHTDFIFASFSEEWGFIGSVMVVLAVSVLLSRLLWYSRRSQSNFESLFIVGCVTVYSVHSLIHIGMNIGILPVTGLPMPFMSFGGSHIVAESIMLGIILGMASRYSTNASRTVYYREFTSLTEM